MSKPMFRYRVRLISTDTHVSQLTTWSFSSKKSAIEFANEWNSVPENHVLCEVFDSKVINTLKIKKGIKLSEQFTEGVLN